MIKTTLLRVEILKQVQDDYRRAVLVMRFVSLGGLVTSTFKSYCLGCHPGRNFVQPPIERRFLQNDRVGRWLEVAGQIRENPWCTSNKQLLKKGCVFVASGLEPRVTERMWMTGCILLENVQKVKI